MVKFFITENMSQPKKRKHPHHTIDQNKQAVKHITRVIPVATIIFYYLEWELFFLRQALMSNG